MDWMGWSPDNDIENTEIVTLRESGHQLEDCGFFKEQVARAVYDPMALQSSIELKSIRNTDMSQLGQMLGYISNNDAVQSALAVPTQAQYPLLDINENTNGHSKFIERDGFKYSDMLGSGW
jgi:hypothetical protein